ncbi:MAG: Mu transposase C-terminal domain-containing protein [Acetobacteraceae bacterium]|nr:Mu transposase C-terminal domain-containing protein [Acetobacteraceae bacterium]
MSRRKQAAAQGATVIALPGAVAQLGERLAKEWFTTAELVDLGLPGLPGTKRGLNMLATREGWADAGYEGVHWRDRQGRGGGIEYHWSVLPETARIAVALRYPPGEAGQAIATEDARRAAQAEAYDRLPATKKAKAERACAALGQVEALVRAGSARMAALRHVAAAHGVALRTLQLWQEIVRGAPRADWRYWLAPQHAGGVGREAECSPAAWERLKLEYLRKSKPNFTTAMREVRRLAPANGWTLPSDRTLQRRLEALPRAILVATREGEQGLKRMLPAQRRDKSGFHALEAVNSDGHTFDVFVKWPDGSVGRPTLIAFQDLYSGKMLSWRVARSENADDWRLAFGDLVEDWGLPAHVWLDNTRAAANKQMTGGVGTRFRFKVKAEDPVGIFPMLNIEVHWTQPFSGQSKPIERAFRDFAQEIAKHREFEGAYTGNSPVTKPENYGTRAVPYDTFLRVLSEGIAEHNARPGRRSPVCRGRSFDAVFAESYAAHAAVIPRATPEQRRLWLLASQAVRVRQDGQVWLHDNGYFHDALHEVVGERVTLRFDPDLLHGSVHVYRLDGAWLCEAACNRPVGFANTAAARERAARVRSWMRAEKAKAQAIVGLSLRDIAEQDAKLERREAAARPETGVVRGVFGGGLVPRAVGATALQPRLEPTETPVQRGEEEARVRRALRLVLPGGGDP